MSTTSPALSAVEISACCSGGDTSRQLLPTKESDGPFATLPVAAFRPTKLHGAESWLCWAQTRAKSGYCTDKVPHATSPFVEVGPPGSSRGHELVTFCGGAMTWLATGGLPPLIDPISTTTSVTTMAMNPAQAQPRRPVLAAGLGTWPPPSGAVRASQSGSSDSEGGWEWADFRCAGRRRLRAGMEKSGGGRADLPSAFRTRLRESWTASNTATLAVRNELRTTEIATLVAATTAAVAHRQARTTGRKTQASADNASTVAARTVLAARRSTKATWPSSHRAAEITAIRACPSGTSNHVQIARPTGSR